MYSTDLMARHTSKPSCRPLFLSFHMHGKTHIRVPSRPQRHPAFKGREYPREICPPMDLKKASTVHYVVRWLFSKGGWGDGMR